jgi:hypothetical protein
MESNPNTSAPPVKKTKRGMVTDFQNGRISVHPAATLTQNAAASAPRRPTTTKRLRLQNS